MLLLKTAVIFPGTPQVLQHEIYRYVPNSAVTVEINPFQVSSLVTAEQQVKGRLRPFRTRKRIRCVPIEVLQRFLAILRVPFRKKMKLLHKLLHGLLSSTKV